MRYKPDSKVLVFVTRKMIKEWCERQVPRKVLGDSHLKNLDNWLKKIGRCANIHQYLTLGLIPHFYQMLPVKLAMKL